MTAQTTAHSPARINPDRTGTLVVVLLLIAALIGASAALSYAGLSSVAPWAGIARDMAWLVPVFIEGAILAYTGAGIVHAARGERARARQAWGWVTLWTLVSSAANGAHAWDAGPGGWQGIVGVALAALFPIGVLIAVHTAAGLIVATVTVAQFAPVSKQTNVPTTVARDVAPVGGARTPAPLAVLEEIEQAGPATTVYDQAASAETIGATGVAGGDVAGSDERRAVAASPVFVTKVATPVAMPVAGDGVTVAGGDERRDDAATDRPVVAVSRRSSGVAMDEDQIVTLARTTHLSGTKIAAQLGTNKNRTCALVRQVRSEQAMTEALWAEPQAALA